MPKNVIHRTVLLIGTDDRLPVQLRNIDPHLRIDVSRDGVEAIERMIGEWESRLPVPDLIVLDETDVKHEAPEVLRKLRGATRTACVPVILLTADENTPFLRECYACGLNSAVLKPDEDLALLEMVTDVAVYWLNRNLFPMSMDAKDSFGLL